MKKILKRAASFWQKESGATAIEYALIAAATGLALAATMPTLQANLTATTTSVANFF